MVLILENLFGRTGIFTSVATPARLEVPRDHGPTHPLHLETEIGVTSLKLHQHLARRLLSLAIPYLDDGPLGEAAPTDGQWTFRYRNYSEFLTYASRLTVGTYEWDLDIYIRQLCLLVVNASISPDGIRVSEEKAQLIGPTLRATLDRLLFDTEFQRTAIELPFRAFLTDIAAPDDEINSICEANWPYWAGLYLSGLYREWFKYFTAVPLAYLASVGQMDEPELPKKPDIVATHLTPTASRSLQSLFPMTGRRAFPSIQRALTHLSEVRRKRNRDASVTPTKRAIRLATFLLRIKDATPPVGLDFFVREIDGHRQTLSAPSKLGDVLDKDMARIMTTVIDSLFVTPDDSFEIVPWSRLKNRLSTRSGELPTQKVGEHEDGVKVFYDRLRASEGIRAETSHRYVNISPHRDTFSVAPSGRVATSLDQADFSFEETFKSEIRQILTSRHPPTAEVIGLKEPLKLRVITVSDAVLQYYGSGIQKDIWKRLQRTKIFELTQGKSVTEMLKVMSDLVPVNPMALLLCQEEPGWVSGDYKGATDCIPQSTTRHAAEKLLAHYAFPSEYHTYMKSNGEIVREPSELHGLKDKLIQNLTGAILDYSQTLRSEYISQSLKYLDRHFGSREAWYSGGTSLSNNIMLQLTVLENAGIIEPVHTQVTAVLQRSGQLMGNILSFPLLCIINLSTYLLAIETYNPDLHPSSLVPNLWVWDKSGGTDPSTPAFRNGRVWDKKMVLNPKLTPKILDGLPVLVNGDDIAFYSDRPFYRHWSDTIGKGGFFKSVGKNYKSPHFMTINSELFYAERGGLTRIKATSYGLLQPDFVRSRFELEQLNKAVAGEYADDQRQTYQIVQREVLQTSPQPEAMNRLFISLNSSHLQSFDAGGKAKLNPFIPIDLGGLGLSDTGLPSDVRNQYPVTHFQRILAGRIRLLLGSGEQPPPILKFHPQAPSHELKNQILRSIRETERFHEEVIRSGLTTHGYLFKPILSTSLKFRNEIQELEDVIDMNEVNLCIRFPTVEGRARAIMARDITDEWITLPPAATGRDELSNRKRQVREILAWATSINRTLSKRWIECNGGDPTDPRTRRVLVSRRHAVVVENPGPDEWGNLVPIHLWPQSSWALPIDFVDF